MRYAQLVMGPAGSGKSTYCSTILQHCENVQRSVQVVNLDPAAEQFGYPVLADVRELVELDDVMEAADLQLGPNGGLVFCMEYLVQNFDWLEEKLGDIEDDYILFDCPGQIELYTHMPVMRQLVETLHQWNFRVCGVFLIDSQFVVDCSKFFAGVLTALSAMIQLEIPHINVMSKMDLLTKKQLKEVDRFLDPDPQQLVEELKENTTKRFRKLNEALAQLIDDYSMVAFQPLNLSEEDSINNLLIQIDNAIQYGEDLDVREMKDDNEDDQTYPEFVADNS
ncbi:GPN-loop GTPase 3-like isoform X2 [Acropora muricata]|uniref:GPN-loop GTPase 3-like isoform X2 n=1 Tax=Acropora muricata TaxID=159855 RepID=UPI0034E4547A